MFARYSFEYTMRMSLLVTLLLSLNIHAVEFGCDSDLAIAHLSALAPSPMTENEIAMGLPLGQTHKPLKATNGWLWETNLGPTFWSDTEELKSWLALREIMVDAERSADLIRQISRQSEFCPPGLSLDFCAHLRGRFLYDLGGHNPEAHKTDGIVIRRDPSEAGKRRAVNKGGLDLKVPWSIDRSTGEFVGINPRPAQLILMMMARENLLRHLRFSDHQGTVRSGAELDLQSRLAVAMRPSLINMIPMLLLRPIEKAVGIMGNPQAPTGGFFTLIERNVSLPGTGEVYRFTVMSSHNKPFETSIKTTFMNIKFARDMVAVPYPENLKFEREFQTLRLRFEDAASTLASAQGLPPKVTLQPVRAWSAFDGMGIVKVETEGLSALDSLLMLYKVADSL